MTEKGELEVVSKAAHQCSTSCAVDVLVYRLHPEKSSAHEDVRRPQIPILPLQPIDFLGKVQKIIALTDDRGKCIIVNCEAFHMSIELDW